MAALLVVVHHFLLANKEFGQGGIAHIRHVTELGACGVDLFFCISGFVMLKSIAHKPDFSSADFALGRVVRIIPLYWITLTLFIALVALNHAQKTGFAAVFEEALFAPAYIASSYLLVPAYNPDSHFIQPFLAQGWTLSYELYFYVLLMLSMTAARANAAKAAVLCSLLLLAGVALAGGEVGALQAFAGNPIAIEFVLGMGVYFLATKTRRFGWLALAAGVVALAATGFVDVGNRLLLWGLPAALVLYGFVALEGVTPAPALARHIGNASYSLYLTHGMLTYVYGGLLKRGWFASVDKQNLAVLGGTVLAVIVSFACYRFVEQPLVRRLGRRPVLPRAGAMA